MTESPEGLAKLVGEILEAEDFVGEVATGDGTVFVVERNGEPGLVVSVEPMEQVADAIRARVVRVGNSSTPAYPNGVPFFPNTQLLVIERLDGSFSQVTWMGLDEPEVLYDDLVRASLEGGWEESPSKIPITTLQRGVETRFIIYGWPMPPGYVHCMDTRPRLAGPEERETASA